MDNHLEPIAPLKRDRLGRVSSTPEQRAEVLAAFERSGLKGKEFAKLAGINYQTFAGWRWANAQRSKASTSVTAPATFVEAVMASSNARLDNGACLEVTLPGGASFRIATPHQADLAARLIQALRAPC